MTNLTKILFVSIITLSFSCLAQEQDQDAEMTKALSSMRARQEPEEQRVMRIIQTPATQNYTNVCTPEQMTRQRLREVGNKDEKTKQFDSTTVNVGHEGMSIKNNKGTVNNDVNVQIVGQNENRCL